VIDQSRRLYTLFIWNNLARPLIRVSSVTIVTALRTEQFGGRIQARATFLLNGYWGYFLGLRRPWLDMDQKFLLSTGLKWAELYPFKIQAVNVDTLGKVFQNLKKCIQVCLYVKGNQFQHRLWAGPVLHRSRYVCINVQVFISIT